MKEFLYCACIWLILVLWAMFGALLVCILSHSINTILALIIGGLISGTFMFWLLGEKFDLLFVD